VAVTIPEGAALITWELEGAGLRFPANTTIGVNDAAGGTPDDKAEIAYDIFVSSFMTPLASAVSLVRCIFKEGPNDTGAFGTHSETTPGGDGGSGASSAVSYLIRKSTALGGRQGRGRMYLPGVTEASVGSDGVVSGAKVTALQDGADQLLNDLVVANLIPVLLHDGALTPTVITALSAQNVVATQRRRQRR
jgi:hypothetical protein